MKGPLYEEVLVDFSSEWKVPVKNRTSSDRRFLITFVVLMALWICIGIYALAAGDVKNIWTENGRLNRAIEHSPMIVGTTFVGLCMCLIFLVLLRWCALPLMIISVTFLTAGYGYLSYTFGKWYTYVADSENVTTRYPVIQMWFLAASIFFGILAIAEPIVVLCLSKKIRLACQLIQEASSAVICMYSSMMVIASRLFGFFIAMLYFIVVALHLAAIESLNTTAFRVLLTFHTLGFIWVHSFITDLGEIVLASAFTTWYWTFDKLKVPSITMFEGAQRAMRYHLGTVALGSSGITVCHSIRLLLTSARSHGRCGIVFWLCSRFFMNYAESFLTYMNRNAYIMCASYGKGWYSSATVALDLIFRNVLRTIALNNIVSWVIYTAKIVICVAIGSLAFWMYHDIDDAMHHWWLPMSVAIILTFFVISIVFDVYVIAIDTIYICFLKDCEHHDGTLLKPYYMSPKLRAQLYKEESG